MPSDPPYSQKMTHNNSYVFTGDVRDRLRAAEEALDGRTKRLIQQLGVGPGQRCLEIGAGGGSVASLLCAVVGESGSVVATDTDVRYLEELPAHPNLEIRKHDILVDPLEEDSFDFAYARLVLQHLADPDIVIAKLSSALRPGGLLLIEDGDHVSVAPVSEYGAAEFAKMQSVRLAAFEAAGVQHSFARSLPARLRAQGFTDVENEGCTAVEQGGSASTRWSALSIDHLRGRLVGQNGLTNEELGRMIELFGDPKFECLGLLLLGVWGRKPL